MVQPLSGQGEPLIRSRSRSTDHNDRLEPQLLRAAENDDIARVRELVEAARMRNQLSNSFLGIGLMRSAEKGSIETTRYLLAEGAQPDGADKNRVSPLLRAVERNHIAIVDLLLSHGADRDAEDKKGRRSALMTAAWKNHYHSLNLLIRRGADLNARDARGRNVLHNLAADKQCAWGPDVMQLLLDQDIHIDGEEGQDKLHRLPIHWACATGKLILAEQLLAKSSNTRAQVEAAEDRGKTGLHIAAAHDRNEIVSLLLRHGAKVNSRSDGGWTPLHNACEKGCVDIVRILVEAGAEINAKLLNGMSPLHLAAEGGHMDVVEALLRNSTIKRAIRDNFGFSPFLRAAQKKNKDIARLLAPFNQIKTLSEDAIGACNGFSATIVDFGNFRNENRVQKQTILELIYLRDPLNHHKPARTILPADNATDFRWIHLPANNMAWVEALLTKAFIEQGASDIEGFKELEKSFSHQHRGRKTHSHFMRPLCQSTPRALPIVSQGADESSTDLGPAGPPTIAVNGRVESHYLTSRKTPTISRGPSRERNGEPVKSPPQTAHNSGKENTKPKPKDKGKKVSTRSPKSPQIGTETSVKPRNRKPSHAYEPEKPPAFPSRREHNQTKKGNIFTFMPYLHFETNNKRHEMQEAIKRAEKIAKEVPRPRLINVNTCDEMLIRAHLATSTMSLHIRRTLDQSFYHNIDTYDRDVDQVVYRYQLRSQDPDTDCDPKVVMVDQLWMWILGKDLIVTAFPQRWQQPKNDPLNVLDSIIEDINSKTRDRVKSVFDLAMIITDRCSGAFSRHRSGDDDYQFLDMFESSIGYATDRETNLFRDFNQASAQASAWLQRHRRPNRFTRYLEPDEHNEVENNLIVLRESKLLDIGQETDLLAEIKDIRDELKMMERVLEDQLYVLPDLQAAVCDIYYEEQMSQGEVKKRFGEQMRGINTHIKDIDRMSQQAKRIYKNVTDMLDLKQKHANAFEARFARDQAEDTGRQSQTVMVFTIVTIIFLPLSFVAAFFSINIREFKAADGDDSMSLAYVCKYMFGIGFAISIPLVTVALLYDDMSTLLRVVQGKAKVAWKGSKQKNSDSFSGTSVDMLELEQVNRTTRERRSRDTHRPGTRDSFVRPTIERAPNGFRMMVEDVEKGVPEIRR
ncbi:ankyrin repeat protein [Calycina marina]|uniref:Ankyrin repeat protein n=1 Tax=Calycina marina TaxID=1763456 RepID=A0A9P8CCV0_9HELO|nr:ankyrin repeat protein [Calycina marina]